LKSEAADMLIAKEKAFRQVCDSISQMQTELENEKIGRKDDLKLCERRIDEKNKELRVVKLLHAESESSNRKKTEEGLKKYQSELQYIHLKNDELTAKCRDNEREKIIAKQVFDQTLEGVLNENVRLAKEIETENAR
jgi:hypothetical protein